MTAPTRRRTCRTSPAADGDRRPPTRCPSRLSVPRRGRRHLAERDARPRASLHARSRRRPAGRREAAPPVPGARPRRLRDVSAPRAAPRGMPPTAAPAVAARSRADDARGPRSTAGSTCRCRGHPRSIAPAGQAVLVGAAGRRVRGRRCSPGPSGDGAIVRRRAGVGADRARRRRRGTAAEPRPQPTPGHRRADADRRRRRRLAPTPASAPRRRAVGLGRDLQGQERRHARRRSPPGSGRRSRRSWQLNGIADPSTRSRSARSSSCPEPARPVGAALSAGSPGRTT